MDCTPKVRQEVKGRPRRVQSGAAGGARRRRSYQGPWRLQCPTESQKI